MNDEYNDILHVPRQPSPGRRRMPVYERAAQFAPFAALTGFDEQIAEEARLTGRRPILSDGEAAVMNEALRRLTEEGALPQRVRLTCFIPDAAKEGGVLSVKEGEVRSLDCIARRLIFIDKTAVALDDIFALAIL